MCVFSFIKQKSNDKKYIQIIKPVVAINCTLKGITLTPKQAEKEQKLEQEKAKVENREYI